ncbi:MAG TPA: YdeI/OmpD-associated family protein [Gemmatimonadales bacterium]
MGKRIPQVDAYIEKAAPFARPILSHIRESVHEACPEVEEAMKWSMPHFMHQGMLAGMAAFKEHCSLGFWKASLIMERGMISRDAMGQFGCIRSIDDLPPRRTLQAYVKKAAALNEAGIKVARKPRGASRAVEVPPELRAALGRNRKAREAFEQMSPSHQREYAEWIAEAKREATRERRLAATIDLLEEGKDLNWKYAKK